MTKCEIIYEGTYIVLETEKTELGFYGKMNIKTLQYFFTLTKRIVTDIQKLTKYIFYNIH